MDEQQTIENQILEEMPALEISAAVAPKEDEKTWFTLAKEEVGTSNFIGAILMISM